MAIGGNVRGRVMPRAVEPQRASLRRRVVGVLGALLLLAMGGVVLAAPASAGPVTAASPDTVTAASPDTVTAASPDTVTAASPEAATSPGPVTDLASTGRPDGRQPATAPADSTWTLAEGKAAVASGVISRVAGAPAQVDSDAITRALRGTNIRVVLLPFKPLATKARDAAGSRAVDLKDWASSEKDYELIEVEGLQVVFSIYDVVPDSMAELQPVLARMDVTYQVEFAISKLRKRDAPPAPTAPDARPADRAQVDTIADALAAHGIYNDPALATPQEPEKGWDSAGARLRAVFLPPARRGTTPTDLVTPLHERFPDDLVVVVRGRWIQAIGPQQDLVHSSLLWMYGYFSRGVLGWQVEPSSLVRLMAERIAVLRTGTVTDQPTPPEPADPVSSLSHTLPWVFAGVALLIVAAVTASKAFGGRKERAARLSAQREATRDRRSLSARLATLAGQVAAIEPLVHGRAMRTQFSSAVERYRVASETLGSDGSVTVAREAIEKSENELADVAAAAGVSLAQPLGDVGAVDERSVIHDGHGPAGGGQQ